MATSVNAWHATRPAAGGAWVQEQRKFYVVPKRKNLPAWQTLYSSSRRGEIVWQPHTAGSVPPGDPGVDWTQCTIKSARSSKLATPSITMHG